MNIRLEVLLKLDTNNPDLFWQDEMVENVKGRVAEALRRYVSIEVLEIIECDISRRSRGGRKVRTK